MFRFQFFYFAKTYDSSQFFKRLFMSVIKRFTGCIYTIYILVKCFTCDATVWCKLSFVLTAKRFFLLHMFARADAPSHAQLLCVQPQIGFYFITRLSSTLQLQLWVPPHLIEGEGRGGGGIVCQAAGGCRAGIYLRFCTRPAPNGRASTAVPPTSLASFFAFVYTECQSKQIYKSIDCKNTHKRREASEQGQAHTHSFIRSQKRCTRVKI